MPDPRYRFWQSERDAMDLVARIHVGRLRLRSLPETAVSRPTHSRCPAEPFVCDLKWVLLGWGVAIFAGFIEYILSYREVWYYKEYPDKRQKLWRFRIFWCERIAFYTAMVVQPIALLLSIALTVGDLYSANLVLPVSSSISK
jgi:hypothetical protein